MWLERFGTVDRNIFFGFCAVVFVIVVLVIVYYIIRICYFCCRHIPVPGYTLTSTLVFSTLFICVSVLFRGVQPAWKTGATPFYTLSNVCQIFVPMIVLGYVMFGAALFIKLWMVIIAYRMAKNVTEFIANFILWVLVIVAGTAIIIWIASFTPNVFEMDSTDTNSSEDSITTSGIFECRGWLEDGSRDREQFAWRIATSVYMAVILLLAVIALPFHACDSELPVPKFAIPDMVATIVICVNATCCVIAGLIVWFRYHPQTSSTNQDWDWYQLEDSRKYAIIGSLQLWMVFVAVVATLIAEILTVRMAKMMYSSDKTDVRRNPNPRPQKHKPHVNGYANGVKKKKTSDADDREEEKSDEEGIIAADGSKEKRRKKKRTKKRSEKVEKVETATTVTSSSKRNSVASSRKNSITKADDDNHSTNKTRYSSADEGFYQDYRSETATVSSPDLRTNGDGVDSTAAPMLSNNELAVVVDPHDQPTQSFSFGFEPTFSSRNSGVLEARDDAAAGGETTVELQDQDRQSNIIQFQASSDNMQNDDVDRSTSDDIAGHGGSAFTAGYGDEVSTAM